MPRPVSPFTELLGHFAARSLNHCVLSCLSTHLCGTNLQTHANAAMLVDFMHLPKLPDSTLEHCMGHVMSAPTAGQLERSSRNSDTWFVSR